MRSKSPDDTVGDLSHRLEVSLLSMLYKVKFNPAHSLGEWLAIWFVALTVTRSIRALHEYALVVLRCTTEPYIWDRSCAMVWEFGIAFRRLSSPAILLIRSSRVSVISCDDSFKNGSWLFWLFLLRSISPISKTTRCISLVFILCLLGPKGYSNIGVVSACLSVPVSVCPSVGIHIGFRGPIYSLEDLALFEIL